MSTPDTSNYTRQTLRLATSEAAPAPPRHDHREHAADARPLSTPTIGVVIPVYNRHTILLETLPYLVAQSRLPDRVVIADDGSTDGSADAAEKWLAALAPPFDWRVLRLPHNTAAAARVGGYQALEGVDFVAFLDSDDHWPADFLERTADALTTNENAVAACVDRRYTDLTGQIRRTDDCRELVAEPLNYFFRRGAGVASCSLLRSVAYDVVGGWDTELGVAEDSLLFSMLAVQGEWVHSPGAPVDFNLGNADARGEENNLSRRNADNGLRWAVVYQQIYDRVKHTAPSLATNRLRRLLARRWYDAGRDLQKLGRKDEAHGCFRSSMRVNPLQLRSLRRLVA
ncbi:MAG: glycosyltransferase family A protein [Planctomycetota bacterium]